MSSVYIKKQFYRLLSLILISFWGQAISFSAVLFAKEVISESRLKMPHKIHVVSEEMECEDCHAFPEEDKAEFSLMPKEEVCAECHEEAEERDNKEGCLFCHNVSLEELAKIEEGKLEVPMGLLSHQSLYNSHLKHKEAEIGCKSCHGEIGQDDAIPFIKGKFMPAPESCQSCHSEEKVMLNMNKDCKSCHKPNTFDKTLEPKNHTQSWTRYHGNHAWFESGAKHGYECSTCHQKESCVDCHVTTTPKDHTQFFKTRGHGIIASGFTERCQTCHRQDSCVSCHQETAPRNHRGKWLQEGHCLSCHAGSNSSVDSNCKVCHPAPIHMKP